MRDHDVDKDVQQAASTVLMELAIGDDQNREDIVKASAIPSVLQGVVCASVRVCLAERERENARKKEREERWGGGRVDGGERFDRMHLRSNDA